MRREMLLALDRSLAEERLVALATVVAGPGTGEQMLLWPSGETLGSLGAPELDARAREDARVALADLACRRAKIALAGQEADVFVEVHAPRPRLIVVGAVHVAIPLVALGRLLGFRTWVVDPRPAFATSERFGHADEIVVDWPREALARIGVHEATYVAVLAHDLKIEVPALVAALAAPARYVGVLGSRKTHARRVLALRDAGVSEEAIGRLHAPIGIDLGGRSPEEIALAIAAEIIAASHGRARPRGHESA